MKKLIMTMAFVGVAIVANAAAFQWSTYTGQAVYQTGTSTKVGTSYTAYLFDANSVSQANLLTALITEGKSITSQSFIGSKAFSSSGTIAKTDLDWGAPGDSLTAYFAVIDGDNVFISTTDTKSYPDTGTSQLQFRSISNPSKGAAIEFSNSASYTGAGWYTAAPEPTSGLLLLLGVAGLALKRKHA